MQQCARDVKISPFDIPVIVKFPLFSCACVLFFFLNIREYNSITSAGFYCLRLVQNVFTRAYDDKKILLLSNREFSMRWWKI